MYWKLEKCLSNECTILILVLGFVSSGDAVIFGSQDSTSTGGPNRNNRVCSFLELPFELEKPYYLLLFWK